MSEAAVMVFAAAAWAGARLALPLPWWVGVALAGGAYAVRRPWLLCVAALVLTAALSAAAREGLEGLPAGPVRGEATLLTDPERFGADVRAEVRLDGRRLEAWAEGGAGERLQDRSAGDRLALRGRAEPFESVDGWRLSRHLAGRLSVTRIASWRPGGPVDRIANRYRALLTRGSRPLDDDQRSLLAGLVLGDDRHQSAVMTDAFRGTGLSHLLAVSGQNVAFVLLVADPLARRLPAAGRLVLLGSVLVLFAVVTRFEPSVLRATAMAGLAITSTVAGRPARGRRALALAVTGLLVVDPLLVHSLGFGLSVAASFGIVSWSARLAGALPLGPWLARPLGVIIAAQLAVAPVLVASLGPTPTASVPANLLAGPAAGPAMVWGMTAGVLAGTLPDGPAGVIHLPTRLLLGWIALVARVGSSLPTGALGVPSLIALACAWLWWRAGPRRPPWHRVGPIVGAAAVAAPMAAAVIAPIPVRVPLEGAVLWRSGGDAVLVVSEETRPVTLLAGLRAARVRGLDLIAAEARLSDATVTTLRDRFGPVPLLAAAGPGPRLPIGPPGAEVTVGSLTVVVRVAGADPVLDVLVHDDRGGRAAPVRSRGALGARAPPL